jgi:hypothetical protein
VLGGIAEPDYKYPWVVVTNAPCKGVLIHPQWVLTAAHCISPIVGSGNTVTYSRTDPYTGALHEEKREPAVSGVHKHPQASGSNNDLALIKLAEPFAISPYIQTVGLPSSPNKMGLVGTVASGNQAMLPPGKIAIFRAPVPELGSDPSFIIPTTMATGALCDGDSGSGFVTYENGRATVRGILSQAGNCVTPAGESVRFMDVFRYRDWILETMRTTDARLAGTNQVRWSGRLSRGVIGIGCVNPLGTMWGPLNVLGVEVGANCEPGQTQTVVCSLNADQPGVRPSVITGFSMKTDCPPHGSIVKSLPFTATWESFNGPAPTSPDPIGVCLREFTCRVGLSDAIDPQSGGGGVKP